MEIQNTHFVVECTRAEILREAKIVRAKFALKNMSWDLPLSDPDVNLFNENNFQDKVFSKILTPFTSYI